MDRGSVLIAPTFSLNLLPLALHFFRDCTTMTRDKWAQYVVFVLFITW